MIRSASFALLPLLAFATACSQSDNCVADCGVDEPQVTDPWADIAPNTTDEAVGPNQTTGGAGNGNGNGTGTPGSLIDDDGDGYSEVEGDCDDSDPYLSPDMPEICDEVDNDCSGVADDNLGWVLVQETDSGADGLIDTITYTTYEWPGKLWSRETDSLADGTIDFAESYNYIYDINGRLYQIETDDLMDGTVDEIKTYHYDANGRLDSYDIDYGNDGTIDRIDTYVYDSNGVRVAWEMDTDADMLVDTLYSYNYDANGRLDSLSIERFDDNLYITSTSWYTYDYNAQGKMDQVHVDLSGDGVMDNTTSYTYDALGRMHEALSDLGRDFIIDSYTVYFYNPQTGDLDKIEMDTDYDGTVDTRITRYEDCYDG